MSRTFKDRPLWVRDADPTEPREAIHQHAGGAPCTLDDAQGRERPGCRWFSTGYSPYGDGPPRDYVHAVWWGPQRAQERDRCGVLARQYNTTGAVDENLEPAPSQHRGSATWVWL